MNYTILSYDPTPTTLNDAFDALAELSKVARMNDENEGHAYVIHIHLNDDGNEGVIYGVYLVEMDKGVINPDTTPQFEVAFQSLEAIKAWAMGNLACYSRRI
jgi:hypothetical protein